MRSAQACSCSKQSARAGATSSAAAVGVGARTSAQKSAMVKSVSCPTPLINGTGLCTMVWARVSSLKAHRSSIEPPPRTSKMASTGGCGPGCCASAYTWCKAATKEAGACSPCTKAGTSTTGKYGARRCKAVTTSCKAAAPSEVTKPIPRGMAGKGRLRSAANRPCACERSFRRRNCSIQLPCPARCSFSTISCKSPRCSYTPSWPCSSTKSPSRGEKSRFCAARRNMAQRSWPVASLIEK